MHKDDEMTPNQRMKGFLSGQSIDRALAMPFTVSMAGKAAGMTHREKRSTAYNQAMAQVACYERFGHDLMIIEYGLHGIGTALGSKTNNPEDAVPALMEYALKDLNDINKLDMCKLELKNDPWFKLNYDACQIAREKTHDEVPVGVLISGPFTAAASVYRTEEFLKSIRKQPDKVHDLIEFCTEALKMICAEFAKIGVVVVVCDPIASGTLLRPKQYREFALPYGRRIMQAVHDVGGMVCYHICGNTKDMLTDMLESGCDMISVDNKVDLEFTKQTIGDKICILGNVDPVQTLMLGSTQDVDNAVKECFKKAYNSPKGYILASGCDIAQAPLENIDQFMASARKYGKWPLDPKNF